MFGIAGSPEALMCLYTSYIMLAPILFFMGYYSPCFHLQHIFCWLDQRQMHVCRVSRVPQYVRFSRA